MGSGAKAASGGGTARTAGSLDVVIAGVGGQGTVLASKLLAQAALLEGRTVRTAETIGMAQRGGSVLGHVRLGRQAGDRGTYNLSPPVPLSPLSPLSPLVPQEAAELLIGFEPGETVRALGYVRRGGAVVTATQALEPVSATLDNLSYDGSAELAYLRNLETGGRLGALIVVDGATLCAELGSPRVLNVILLGAALATGRLGLTPAALTGAIETLVKPAYVELNKRALARGMETTTS
jgi:indolepyruvate ferredoxin oxidoreductase beta subunit